MKPMFEVIAALTLLLATTAFAQFDHSHKAFDDLLKKHVSYISNGNASQVAYAGFATDRAALKAYLDRVSAVPEATGYLAFITGGKMGPGGEMGDMVLWTSSASRQFGGGLSDWLSPSQVAGLVKDKTVLPPTATSCAGSSSRRRRARPGSTIWSR